MAQEKFQNKYRIASIRAQWWDYGWNGAYFITICTQNRAHYFGEIENGKMILSHAGVIAQILWNEIPKHHQHIELGAFVVMPNHIHGIIIIDKPDNTNIVNTNGNADTNNGNDTVVGVDDVVGDFVETGHALILQQTGTGTETQPGGQRFQNIGKNTISSVVGSYKSAVTKYANRLGYPNGWQPLFYDNIIRNNNDYQRISEYIVSNPQNWDKDKFY